MYRRILIVVFCAALIALLCSSAATQLVFEPGIAYEITHRSGPIAAGDVTGDGHVDILVGNGVTDGAITLLVNQGDGTFALAPPFYAVGRLRQLVLTHLDSDGMLDLVTAVEGEAAIWRIHVARGTGSGNFGAAVEIWRVPQSFPTVAVGDVTGDDNLDIVVATDGYPFVPDRLDIVPGHGDGSFGPAVNLEQSSGTGTPENVAVGDVDGDAIDDIIVARTSAHAVRVYISLDGGGIESFADHGVSFFPALVALADFDNDGALDIVTGTDDGSDAVGLAVLAGVGDGTFGAPQPSVVPPGVFIADLAVARADDDGFVDLLTASSSLVGEETFNRGVLAYRGLGDGTFKRGKLVSIGGFGVGLIAADFDGDGLDDAALGGNPFSTEVQVTANRTYASADPFADLGADLHALESYPILLADGSLTPGQIVTFGLRSATPDAGAFLVVGYSLAVLPFGGGTLLPAPDLLVGPIAVPSDGALDYAGAWPEGVPSGFTFWTQVWLEDATGPAGYAATSTVRTVTP